MRNIEYLSPQELRPWPGNSRRHSRKQIRQLTESIRRFGFTAPVVIDEAGRILAGHGRVQAACALGLVEIPCHRLNHLSETEKRAYVIADNKLALNSTWDRKTLAQEINHFRTEAASFEIGVIGFTIKEMNGLLQFKSGRPGARAAPTRCAPGDVWELGPHRLVCGERLHGPVFEGYPHDCVEEMIIIKTPDSECPDSDGAWRADALLFADKARRLVLFAEPDPAKCDRILARWEAHSSTHALKFNPTNDHSPVKPEVSR